MDQLIEDNMPLVASIVKQFQPRNATERQDLLDAGRIGLWKALKKHNPSQGCISTYAWRPIRWAIIREIKNSKHHVSIEDITPPQTTPIENIWEYYPSDMTDEEKNLVDLRCQGYKFREICQIVDETPSVVKGRFYKALRKIQEANEL